MGFLNEFCKGAANYMNKKMENINRYKAQYSRYSDERLLDIYYDSYGDKKIAIGTLLRERGYNP